LPYPIEYSPDALEHLKAFTARQRAIIVDAVEEQLSAQPTVCTRNRKPLRPNVLATWELRVGNLRVYYDTIDDDPPMVCVRVIGIKQRSRILVGGKEIAL
jgi:mRNA-degrading endonuclease RelE of RelBE toxin-antitoxin system